MRVFVQRVGSNHSVMRGLVNKEFGATERAAFLRQHSFPMQEVRDTVEALASQQEAPAPYEPVIAKVSQDLVDIPAISSDGRKAELRVSVVKKEMTAEGIVSLRLEPTRGVLPTFRPG